MLHHKAYTLYLISNFYSILYTIGMPSQIEKKSETNLLRKRRVIGFWCERQILEKN